MSRPAFASSCRLMLCVLAAAALAACGASADQPPCEDELDNDDDGLIDGDDPSCAAGNPDESDDPVRDCNDGEDNDDDGLIDFPADPGCDNGQDNSELNSPVPECDDGEDNDDDGKTDFPADPGCFSPLQDSEADDCPDGPNCPECSNGVDDDGDDVTDFPADNGCTAASDNQERTQDLTACNGSTHEPLTPGVVVGMLAAGTQATLTSATCGGTGVEKIYELYVDEPRVMVATTNLASTQVDTVLYVRSRCADAATELACNDDVTSLDRQSTITVPLEPGYYYLIVDGKSSAAVGNYQLEVEFFPGVGTTCDPEATDPCAPGLSCRQIAGNPGPTCEEPVCSDGRDDDEDGLTDHPFDPGCASPGDDTETDVCPDGVTCPACGNGRDDDGDLLADYPEDPDCMFAGQIVEGCATEIDPIVAITTPTTTGTTTGAHDNFDPACGSSGGVEIAHILNLPVTVQTLVIDTIGTAFDTLVYVQNSSCNGTYLGCDDDGAGTANNSRLTLNNVAAGGYAVFVDGYTNAYSGPYTLHVQGTVAPLSACTDPMFTTGVLACPTTHPCNGTICALAQCNDGINNADGDVRFDYPNDPGCTSANDPSEADTCPAGIDCPVCSNGMDDDGDNMTDYPADTGCPSAGADDETGCASGTDPFDEITTPRITGTFANQGNDLEPSCLTGSGRDLAYLLDVPFALSTLYLDTEGSTPNTAIAVRPGSCGAADLACDNNSGDDGSDAYLVMSNVPADRYAVIVDTTSGSTGAFTLNVRGVIAEGSRCDPAQSALYQCVAHAACTGTPGAETCMPLACADGISNDADALIDALDPGCMSLADNTEADPASPPQCANTLEDDGDGLIDYPADLGCKRAADPLELLCPDASGVTELTTARVTATTAGAGADSTAGCVASSSGAPDRIYSVTVPGNLSTVTFNANLTTVGGGFDKVIYVRRGGCTTDVGCADSGTVTLTNAVAGTYFVYVDGNNTNAGPFTLDVTGVIAADQPCDPLQIQAGMFTCAGTTACTNNVCQ